MTINLARLLKLADIVRTRPLPWPAPHRHLFLRKRTDRVDAAQSVSFDDLPDAILRSIPARRYEYIVGRLAASELLCRLGVPSDECWVGSKDGRPIWPAGILGSISHTKDLVVVTVVPRSEKLHSVGIDIEYLHSEPSVLEALLPCFNEQERLLLSRVENGLLVGFSTKEALFKCLSLEAGRYFDFREAEITMIDVADQIVEIQLLTSLSTRLGKFEKFRSPYRVVEQHVCTGILWGS